MKNLKEMEEMEGNHYRDYIRSFLARGRKIITGHAYKLSTFRCSMKVEGMTPFVRRAFSYESVPDALLRVYCSHCGKIRTLIFCPSKAEFRASCRHVLEDAVEAAAKDYTQVCVDSQRIVPAGVAQWLELKIVG